MDKHFPDNHPLSKIFNRNCVKMSYRCTANLGGKIAAHMCPFQNKCLTEGVVYQALVERSDGVTESYVGLTEKSFKDRWTKHKSSFKTRNPKNATGLSRYVWKLMDEQTEYNIKWSILSRAKTFNPASGVCRLCVREKFFILFKPDMSTLNARNEIACLHKSSRLLTNL